MKISNTEFKELVNSKGGLFDVRHAEMELNIGKTITYNNPTCGIEKLPATIEGIQKIYNGEIFYRVCAENDKFGRPADPKEITIK